MLFSMNSLIILGTTSVLIASMVLHFWRHLQRRDTRVLVPEHTTFDLPEGWWSDPARFQLEQRAIFSQTWICVSHRGRFRSPGDYVVHDAAGFRILMISGKDMVVRSFHNVCRHRAFPVARKQSGSATVLGCRYHGWSYNTEGKLIKAPHFDNLPGFDKNQNNLFEIYTKQDSRGFLHINVSRDEGVPAIPTSTGLETGKLEKHGPDTPLLDSIEFSGKFNWKVILNRPCATSHPTESSFTDSAHPFPVVGPSSIGDLIFRLTTVPTMSGRPFWYQLTYLPVAVDQTNLRCDIYANNSKGSFKLDGAIKDSLEKEIQQKLLDFENQYTQLITSSDKTIGNGDQAKIADAVEMHRRQEALRGFEIKPAAFKQPTDDAKLSKADRICQAMDCNSAKKLDW
ncbi:Rieske [2Fe-2S] iron-sulfur domain-containing protein [Fusarium sp. MPI-SDFR-AT-0072]|nr:Rieske [2Fe-2S] iron-sulfur domain-containing protein [Fusarium sp. MPI-SDFR-AT-0072]